MRAMLKALSGGRIGAQIDLRTIKAGPLLREDAFPGQVEEQLPAEEAGEVRPRPRGGEEGTVCGPGTQPTDEVTPAPRTGK